MRASAQKASPNEVVVPRTLGAPAPEVLEICSQGPRLAIAAADLMVAVAERTTGRVQWRSEAWIDRFGEVDTLNKHLPDSMDFAELPLPPAGENWRRARSMQTVEDDEVLFDLVLIGASTERGTHYVTVLATERIGSGMVISDRPQILDMMDEALLDAEDQSVAAMYVDLDRFENIVAEIGNVQAVRIVEQVSRKISSTMRATDMLFRLQGDEFMLIAVGLQSRERAEELGERIRSAIATLPEPADGFPLTASVGVALNNSGQKAYNLLAASETAVHLAKGRGRNRVVLADEALPSRSERLVTVERQLRRAIEHRNVRFAFQPLVDLKSRDIIGAEALLRIGGDVGLSATEVVATAERSGLMGALGMLVIEGVEEKLGGWLTEPNAGRLAMVNVAPQQLMDADFMTLVELIASHESLANRFGIEVAAPAALGNLDLINSITNRLSGGVELGVDGWADLDTPLALFADAGVTYVKLHRNLVSQLPGEPAIQARAARLVGEARQRGIDILAIGVEKESEVEALLEIGCTKAQGFLFSAAVPAEDFLRSSASV